MERRNKKKEEKPSLSLEIVYISFFSSLNSWSPFRSLSFDVACDRFHTVIFFKSEVPTCLFLSEEE